jgi:hypothetical protein
VYVAYYTKVRRKNENDTVNARIDVLVVKQLVDVATNECVNEFRASFYHWFPKAEEYQFNSEDDRTELKALLLLLSIALMNASDPKGRPGMELIPFLKEVVRFGLYFEPCLKCVPAILFGIAESPVSASDHGFVADCQGVELTFVDFFCFCSGCSRNDGGS